MVSIVVPVYNVEYYLDKCLQSIVNQTFKDIEIIVINDGSTDKSEEICLKWQKYDDRIIYVKKKNEGLGPTRNLGVSIAKGEYITFVDSDDWIERDTVECMYEAAKKSNADIVISDINYIVKDSKGNINCNVSRLRIENDVIVDAKKDIKLIDKARLNAWGKLYKREFYINSKIIQPAHAFEDAPVIPLLIAKADTIYHVSKPLYNYYRSRTESIVNNFKCYSDLRITLQEMKDGFEKEGLFEKYYEALKKVSYAQVRFIYKKLLGEKEEVDPEYKYIINNLYDFMDSTYPDWINIDKYNVGVLGDENLKKAVINTVFNNFRIEYSMNFNKELFEKDILIIDLVNELFYKDFELWKNQCIGNLEMLEENFRGKQIITVRFLDDIHGEIKNAVDNVYNIYKNSNLNVSIIEFKIKRNEFDENSAWDLSDEILQRLMKG